MSLHSTLTLSEWINTEEGKKYLSNICKSIGENFEKDLTEIYKQYRQEIGSSHRAAECEHEWVGNQLQITHCKKCGMIEVNKPAETTPNMRCYKCKAEFYVHPMVSMNAPYITECELHNQKCEHEREEELWRKGGSIPDNFKCKHCGEFYR